MMRVAWAVVIFSMFGMAAAHAIVTSTPRNDLIIDASPQTCIEGIAGEICHHFFSGVKVNVTIPELSFRLRGANRKAKDLERMRGLFCVRGILRLFQVSSRLEAPIGDEIEIGAVGETDCDALTKAPCPRRVFSLDLPQVEHETEFRIEFTRSSNVGKCLASTVAGSISQKPVFVIAVKAYPRTLMNPVKSWAEYGDNALIVQDREGRLLDFLDRYKVKYLTRDTMPNAGRKLHIVVGDPPEREERDEITGNVIYLQEKTDILPVVRIRETPQRMTVKVKTRLLDQLAADDPLAQKAFVEIFKEIAK